MGFLALPGLISGAYNATQNKATASGVTPEQVQQSLAQDTSGINQQQQFLNALQPGGVQGLQAQQQLLSQLGLQAQGQGPNPALLQLQNTTGQNVAQQAALQASQRGVGQNAGMIARQAAQQGQGIQQQALGQAALLRAQQQLAAQQMLGQQAAQSVGQQQQGLGQLNAAQQGMSGQVLGANAQQNAINAGIAGQNAATNKGIIGGATDALGKIFTLAEGGQVPQGSGPMSIAGQFLRASNMKSGGHVPGKASVKGDSEKNDTVPVMLSPGELVIPRSHATDPKKAAAFAAAVINRNRGKK